MSRGPSGYDVREMALRPTVLRWESMAMSLVAAVVLAIWPAVAHAARASPLQAVIDGHCVLVDAHGVPLTDPLYWQRTGHDPC